MALGLLYYRKETMTITDTIPRPASGEAMSAGCLCPGLVNDYGRTMPERGWVFSGRCPMHGWAIPENATPDQILVRSFGSTGEPPRPRGGFLRRLWRRMRPWFYVSGERRDTALIEEEIGLQPGLLQPEWATPPDYARSLLDLPAYPYDQAEDDVADGEEADRRWAELQEAMMAAMVPLVVDEIIIQLAELIRPLMCPRCRGTQRITNPSEAPYTRRCPKCKGTGIVA